MFGENLPLILAAVAICLAIVQAIRPFGARVPPGLLIVIALLLGLRWAMRRQTRVLRDKLKQVPQHPLGISDEHPD
jgi:hypothetical protein